MVNPSNLTAGVFISSPSSLYETALDGGLSILRGRNLTNSIVSGHRVDTAQQQEKARRQLVEAGQEFEAYFISYLLKVMRETIPQGAVADRQGSYFHFLSDQEIGRRAAESGGIGLQRMFLAYAEQYRS